MKLRKYLAALLAVLVVAVMLPSTHAYALSDLDFTINVDNSKEYVSGYTVEAPIIIKTQNQKGYVELKMLLKYNADALSCETILNDWEGFTTEIVEEGLQITYLSPDGTPSKAESEYVLNIKFAVRTGVASGTYPLELIVNAEDVYSLDSNGNKENGKLTISDAKIKDLTIVETNDDNITQPQGDGSDPNYYFTNPSITQDVEDNGGGASAGLIIGIIIGALVVFAAGVVVGFILCQKRMTEDSYIDSGDRGSRYSGDTYGSGRRNIYDDDDDDNSYTARRTVSRRPSVVDEDELV
ncbi:MAG: hypothetical protein IJC18_05680, partial [Clostridia bacterium]|nr:hypothetical protein [Clostridia bacterium]